MINVSVVCLDLKPKTLKNYKSILQLVNTIHVKFVVKKLDSLPLSKIISKQIIQILVTEAVESETKNHQEKTLKFMTEHFTT